MGKRGRDTNSAAVMARKAPRTVEDDSPQVRLWRSLDFFPTPPWATRAGAEILRMLDPRCRVVREPACGEGHMAGPLREYFEVLPSDVHDHGRGFPVVDWLDPYAWGDEPDCDWIFSNPPFGIADTFVKLGLKRARRGVALLLRLAFIEGVERYQLMAGEDTSLTVLAPFSERVPMTLGRWQVDATSATAYAWFFWMKDAAARPVRMIAPGTRRRLSRPTDASLYGWQPPVPLLEGLAPLTTQPDTVEGLDGRRAPGTFCQTPDALADDAAERRTASAS